MTRALAYMAIVLAAAACTPAEEAPGWVLYPPADALTPMPNAPLADRLAPKRFLMDKTVYYAELRQRRTATASAATGYDIAVSREGRAFVADYGSRGEAGPVASAYCTAMGGRLADGLMKAAGGPVFHPARQADRHPEWVFPAWCVLSGATP